MLLPDPFNPFNYARWLIYSAGLLVPQAHRKSWRGEWEAEAWHAWRDMRDRGETPGFIRAKLVRFCRGSFADAAWHRINLFDRDEALRWVGNQMRSPAFSLAVIAVMIGVLALASGSFTATRSVLLPLPYDHANRIATVSQSGISLSSRAGVPLQWVALWQAKSKLVEESATYGWREELAMDGSGRTTQVTSARVSENFFSLFGAHALSGRVFRRGDSASCRDCVVLSYNFWRKASGARPIGSESKVLIGGRRYRVLGVTDPSFWFLSRRIAVWSLAGSLELGPDTRTGVVVRLAPDATRVASELELEKILNDAELSPWISLVEVSLVQQRVRSVFGSFALALALAIVMAVLGFRPGVPKFDRGGCARALFFSVKTALLLAGVLLAGLEFTRATSITMIGGTDLATEPLSTWLFLLGSMGVLSWSIHDQSRRCRVCLRRLGLAAHVGCPGCLLLNWAGTELVCVEGHGILHVAETSSSCHDQEKWTALDESWVGLFARKAG